jgi:5,5'-dehydrodivanillate O-demethylase
MWTMDRLCILPNLFAPGHFEWRVPIDDVTTRNIIWHFTRVPEDMEPYHQGLVPYWYSDGIDPSTAHRDTSHVVNQDTVAWVGQGEVTDRTREHLGRSDRGIVMLRRQLQRDMEAVAEGMDPKGLVRDPAENVCIAWPQTKTVEMKEGLPRDVWLALDSVANPFPDDFFLLSGQPPSIQAEYERAIGR